MLPCAPLVLLTSATWFIIHRLELFVKHFFRFFYFVFLGRDLLDFLQKYENFGSYKGNMPRIDRKGILEWAMGCVGEILKKLSMCGQKHLTDGHSPAIIST